MRNISRRAAISPNDPAVAAAMDADYLRYKLRTAPGNNTDLVNSSGKVYTTALTITNGASGDWTTRPGWWTPGAGSGASNRYNLIHDAVDATVAATMQSFYTPNADGQHVYVFDMIQTRDAPSTEYVHSVSPNHANGGYGIRLATNGFIQVMAGVTAALRSQYDITAYHGTRVSICAVLDWKTLFTSLYVNGAVVDSGDAIGAVPTISMSGGAGGVCLGGLTSNTTPTLILNSPTTGTQSGVSLRDFTVIKTTTDRASDMATLAAEAWKHPGQLANILKGW